MGYHITPLPHYHYHVTKPFNHFTVRTWFSLFSIFQRNFRQWTKGGDLILSRVSRRPSRSVLLALWRENFILCKRYPHNRSVNTRFLWPVGDHFLNKLRNLFYNRY